MPIPPPKCAGPDQNRRQNTWTKSNEFGMSGNGCGIFNPIEKTANVLHRFCPVLLFCGVSEPIPTRMESESFKSDCALCRDPGSGAKTGCVSRTDALMEGMSCPCGPGSKKPPGMTCSGSHPSVPQDKGASTITLSSRSHSALNRCRHFLFCVLIIRSAVEEGTS